MLRQRISRRLVTLQGVALLALVQPWGGSKLRLVLVVMAIHALRKLDLVEGVLPLCDVTLHALEFRVPSLQRILRRRMRLQVKLRRLPSVHVVAR